MWEIVLPKVQVPLTGNLNPVAPGCGAQFNKERQILDSQLDVRYSKLVYMKVTNWC